MKFCHNRIPTTTVGLSEMMNQMKAQLVFNRLQMYLKRRERQFESDEQGRLGYSYGFRSIGYSDLGYGRGDWDGARRYWITFDDSSDHTGTWKSRRTFLCIGQIASW